MWERYHAQLCAPAQNSSKKEEWFWAILLSYIELVYLQIYPRTEMLSSNKLSLVQLLRMGPCATQLPSKEVVPPLPDSPTRKNIQSLPVHNPRLQFNPEQVALSMSI